MGRCYNKRRWPWWSELLVGIAMLSTMGLIAFIGLANAIGLGYALAKVVIVLFGASWLATGVILTVRGLSRTGKHKDKIVKSMYEKKGSRCDIEY